MENSKLPPPIKAVAAKRVADAASKAITADKVVKKLGVKLCRKLPSKMKEKGLTVTLVEAFRELNYLVLELQVQHVDAMTIQKDRQEANADLTADDDEATNSMAGTLLEWSLWLVGQKNQQKLEGEFLPKKVQEKLEKEMFKLMAEKFEAKGLKADVQVLKEELQARFFYQKLSEVHEANELKKGSNPIKEFRKKLSTKEDADDSDSDDSF